MRFGEGWILLVFIRSTALLVEPLDLSVLNIVKTSVYLYTSCVFGFFPYCA